MEVLYQNRLNMWGSKYIRCRKQVSPVSVSKIPSGLSTKNNQNHYFGGFDYGRTVNWLPFVKHFFAIS